MALADSRTAKDLRTYRIEDDGLVRKNDAPLGSCRFESFQPRWRRAAMLVVLLVAFAGERTSCP
jgi:hypothetical protein